MMSLLYDLLVAFPWLFAGITLAGICLIQGDNS
jgi:hypothetical protein